MCKLHFVSSVPPNGIIDMLIQHSRGTPSSPQYVNVPNIIGQDTPIAILPLPEHSTLVYIYHDPSTKETAFHPVQADQHCHRFEIHQFIIQQSFLS